MGREYLVLKNRMILSNFHLLPPFLLRRLQSFKFSAMWTLLDSVVAFDFTSDYLLDNLMMEGKILYHSCHLCQMYTLIHMVMGYQCYCVELLQEFM